ncbi:MAG: TolC family protein [Candidatus Omnitrophica bacterium]|nr:TolC family protein [Candidatus Omnitrophota bacterium]MCF7893454.1 TolC family protein [Candidatus Omnitrophota bacterium]
MRKIDITKSVIILCCLLPFFLLTNLWGLASEKKTKSAEEPTILIAQDGSCPEFKEIGEKTKKALIQLRDTEKKVIFKSPPKLNAQWNPAKLKEVLNSALKYKDIDLILLQGVLLTKAAARSKIDFQKPVLSSLIHDPEIVGLAYNKKGFSSKNNFIFLALPGQFKKDMAKFKKLVNFKKLSVIFDALLLKTFPDIEKNIKQQAKKMGFRVKIIPVAHKARPALKKLSNKTEAVYLTPVSNMGKEQWQKLIKGINQKKIPSFSLLGKTDVERGVLAGLLPDMSDIFPRWKALAISRVLDGTSPDKIPVKMELDIQLSFNQKTAEKIGFNIPLGLGSRIEAETVGDEGGKSKRGDKLEEEKIEKDLIRPFLKPKKGARLSYQQAIKLALQHNIDLDVNRKDLRISRENRNQLLTDLFPQIAATAGYKRVDYNQADISEGFVPEYSSTAGASASQIIFNDPIWSAYRSASWIVEKRRMELESLRLDIQHLTETLFLDCLTARSVLEVDRGNHDLSRKNLEVAQTRMEIGVSGPDEVDRWRSRLAREEVSLLQDYNTFRDFIIDLNRVIGVNQDSRWKFQDIVRGKLDSGFSPESFGKFLSDQHALAVLKDFAFKTALAHSPEMKAVKKAITAEKIMLAQAKRSFIMPEVSAFFDYDYTIDQHYVGAGSTTGPSDDENHWQLGLKATIPIFSGGGNIVDIEKREAKVERFKDLYNRALQQVEKRVKTAVVELETTWPQIEFSKTAAKMAEKNLKIIKDKYSDGTASILRLLDAQTNAQTQNRLVVLANYRYQKAVTDFLRAICWRSFVESRAHQAFWFKKLKERINKERK